MHGKEYEAFATFTCYVLTARSLIFLPLNTAVLMRDKAHGATRHACTAGECGKSCFMPHVPSHHALHSSTLSCFRSDASHALAMDHNVQEMVQTSWLEFSLRVCRGRFNRICNHFNCN